MKNASPNRKKLIAEAIKAVLLSKLGLLPPYLKRVCYGNPP